MTTDGSDTFAALLSRYRVALGVTQEELAERAGLSARGISDLERGLKSRPRAYTVRQLADALQLSAADRARFERAALAANTVVPVDDTRPSGEFLGALPAHALVGRGEEGERISAILDAVAEEAGHLLLLGGEMGAGKTRLLQEVMVAALQHGFVVLTGRCDAAEQGTPYAPFVDALAQLPPGVPATARGEVQRGWRQVQQLVRADPADEGTGPGDPLAQQQMATAVSDLLLRAARAVPLALLLDDLQWADRDSVKLLLHLARTARRARLLLAIGVCDARLGDAQAALAQVLRTLSREHLAERITVRPLSLDETTQMVAATMGRQEVSDEFASFVYRRTKGNPRLIDGLVRSLGGRLELQGEIGAGAMGRVFRAYDQATGMTVAAKLVLARAEIDLDTLVRFQQEGAVLAALSHPHIVTIYDTFAGEHASCIIMELLDGPSLGHILRDGPLPLPRAQHLALQVAEALSYAHAHRIVHRDIKPDNVMVLADDQVKVTDFGIARILQPDTSLQTFATTGMRLGTPLYMAPEQIAATKIDGRTDVYALGALLYHMVTGQPPFEGSDALAVAVKHLQEEPTPPSALTPSVSADWDALILKALEKDPAQRFQSAREMEQAIAALSDGATTRAERSEGTRGDALGRARPRSTPRWIAAPAGLLVLVGAVVVGLVYTPSAPRPPTPTIRRSGPGARIDAYLAGLAARGKFSGSVLVARQGAILLRKGYGLADRARKRPNTPDTSYAVSGVAGSLAFLSSLWLEDQGKLPDQAPICRYLTGCPASWKPITVHMVLAGTSALPTFNASTLAGYTTAQTLRIMESEPLAGRPGAFVNYQNGEEPVLALIAEKVSGLPWATFIQRAFLGPAGMTHSGRLTAETAPPTLAQSYADTTRTPDATALSTLGSVFAVYAPAADVYAYDNALFGGTLVSRTALNRMFMPRAVAPAPSAGFTQARYGYWWSSGLVAGHRVVYTVRSGTANLRFPQDGVTIVVIANSEMNDVGDIAVRTAEIIFGRKPAVRAPLGAVVSTFRGQGTVGNFPAAFTSGALWFPTQSPNGYMGTVTRIDTRTGRVVATINVSGPHVARPEPSEGDVVAANGQVWAVDSGTWSLVRIDPATNKVVATIHLGIPAAFLASSGDTVWATTDPTLGDAIVRVDLRTQKVVATIANAGQPNGDNAATPDAFWYISRATLQLMRVDAATNKVVATVNAGPAPQTVFVGAGSVWVGDASGALVTRIDPRTNKVVATITTEGYPGNRQPSLDNCNCRYAVGDGSVWVIANDTTLLRIDPRTNRRTGSLTFNTDIGSIALSEGSVWVSSDGGNPAYTIYRVNPQALR